MIVKFHSRGTGSGSGPVDYLLGQSRDRPEATLLRGDADLVAAVIDSSAYAKKYTSGVLSFQEVDLHGDAKDQLMSGFERALLPGLDADQYVCLWVEHRDKGRLELNFVVPNVELLSGKRLQPYFDRADQPRINAWKVCANAYFQLHDPDDPMNKRELVTPRDLPSRKQEASQAITAGLLHLASSGELTCREDVLEALEETGFTVARTTKRSISIADPDGGQNIRLKGRLYEQDFRFGAELRGEIEAASQRYRADTERRVQAARRVYKTGVAIKREQNQQRYPRSAITVEQAHCKALDVVTDYPGEHFTRRLGRSLATGADDYPQLDTDQRTERIIIPAGQEGQQTESQSLFEPAVCRDAQQAPRNLHGQARERVHDTQRLLKDDDRVRNPLTERLHAIGATVQRAARGFADSTTQLAKDVRDYFTGKPETGTASAVLERTGASVERQNTITDGFIEQQKTINQLDREKEKPQTRKNENTEVKGREKGFEMEL